MTNKKILDAIMIGRAGVDLYGDQIGGRLEDMGSFSKYIGGSPTNTSIGAARLGLKTALVSRVGNDAMGEFIRQELDREGVDTSSVTTDPTKMTALVILGIKDKEQFPLIFFRENCADMAISIDDIDEEQIARARAVVTSGTHFSTQSTKEASLKALELALKHGASRWVDLDYRPVLWELTGKGDGETRFIADNSVTQHLQNIMEHMDVVVGTEEEIHIAGGTTNTIECLKSLRQRTDAIFVVKLGAMGCVVFEHDIPDHINDGLLVEGFPVEVFNVLGAGDAFMSGLLTAKLEGKNWREACRFANACGAFAVSRHACAPAYPSRIELEYFLANGSQHFSLRKDQALEQLHWSTTRHHHWPEVLAFAFDHRSQLEEFERDATKIEAFKQLCAEVVLEVKARYPERGIGSLCDRRYGLDALNSMTGNGMWLASPVEWPGSYPLTFENGGHISGYLKEFPREVVVKCLLFAHPDDSETLWKNQLEKIQELAAACRTWRLELLLEIIPSKDKEINATIISRCMDKIYGIGVAPDWWKLPAPTHELWEETWYAISACIEANDPHCRGVVLLGLAGPMAQVKSAIAKSRHEKWCKGFAVGRTIFNDAAQSWFSSSIDDAKAKSLMAKAFDELITAWSH